VTVAATGRERRRGSPVDRRRPADRRRRPRRGAVGDRPGRWADVAWVGTTGLVAVQAYTLIHEGGHALAAWTVGVTVIGIEPWFFVGPRVRMIGGLHGAAGAWIAVAGTLLPLVLAATAFAALRVRGQLARWAVLAGGLALLGSLLPWIAFPLLGLRPPGDDVTHLLQRSGVAPAVVAAAALAAAIGLATLTLRAVGGVRAVVPACTGVRGAGRSAGAWLVTLLLLAAVAGASLALAAFGADTEAPRPPTGFVLAAGLDLAGGLFDDHLLGDLAIEPHALEVWVEVRDARGPLRVELVGPDGGRTRLLSLAADATMRQGSARTPVVALGAGPWSVRATAAPGPGRLAVGWRTAP